MRMKGSRVCYNEVVASFDIFRPRDEHRHQRVGYYAYIRNE